MPHDLIPLTGNNSLPRNMMNPAWPKRIVGGQAEWLSSNAHKTGLSESQIG